MAASLTGRKATKVLYINARVHLSFNVMSGRLSSVCNTGTRDYRGEPSMAPGRILLLEGVCESRYSDQLPQGQCEQSFLPPARRQSGRDLPSLQMPLLNHCHSESGCTPAAV